MEIKDVKANQGNVELVAEVKSKESPRTFEKFGKKGKVCNAVIKDKSGEITLTLWNDEVDTVKVGDKIHLKNGWCSEYKGSRQLSAGKFGKIEILEASAGLAASAGAGSKTVFTNDPSIISKQRGGGDDDDDDDDSREEEPEEGYDEEFVD